VAETIINNNNWWKSGHHTASITNYLMFLNYMPTDKLNYQKNSKKVWTILLGLLFCTDILSLKKMNALLPKSVLKSGKLTSFVMTLLSTNLGTGNLKKGNSYPMNLLKIVKIWYLQTSWQIFVKSSANSTKMFLPLP